MLLDILASIALALLVLWAFALFNEFRGLGYVDPRTRPKPGDPNSIPRYCDCIAHRLQANTED